MTSGEIVRFDEAWRRAQGWARQQLAQCLSHVVLVRDLYGRVRIALDDRGDTSGMPSDETTTTLAQDFVARLGRFAPEAGSVFLRASQMFAPDEVFASADTLSADVSQPALRVLERLLVGADWLRTPSARPEGSVPRLTLHGIKGGVGRSTAASVLAWRLAASGEQGKRILMIDLDLESPGIGSTLLESEARPDFGVVDWLIEQAVGQADADLLREMCAPSPLAQGRGEILVVPAVGRESDGYAYLQKLGRAYNEIAQREARTGIATMHAFGDRIAELLAQLEAEHRPDLTIVDSRAGLHDIAAIAVTRLQATSLLFAIDTPQTWDAYHLLFDAWREQPERVRAFRDRLKVVAALTPETHTADYLEALRDRAYELFQTTLYEEARAEDADAFNFDPTDEDAPHSPLRIHWQRSLQQFDPVRQPGSVTDEQLRAGFGDFVNGVHQLVFGEGLP